MRRKFTKKYLNKRYNEWFFCSCFSIDEEYHQYLKQYRRMIRKQFKINPRNDSLEGSTKCLDLNYQDVNLLRVLLLMSFEDAILNGEIK